VLTLSVAAGFARLFADGRFLLPVVLAVVAGHGVAWWCRRNELPTGIAAIASLGAVGLVAAWTVLGHTTAYGIPLPLTVRTALDVLGTAQQQFSTVRAPADALPGFVLATVLAVGISAFMADWAAFRLGATFEAVVPAFTLFVFTAFLGTARHRTWSLSVFVASVLGFLLVQGMARTNRAGAWFGGKPANGPRSLVRTAIGLGGVALVGALIVGPLIPGPDSAIVKYKNRGRSGPTSRATISPLVDIRTRLVNQSGTEVFTVESPVKSYWRLTSLDTFDGSIWSSNDTYRPTGGTIRTDELLQPGLPTQNATQKFSVSLLASIWLPAAFRPQRVDGIGDVSYNRDTASLITPQETTDGLDYTVVSDVPTLTPELLAGAPDVAPQEIATRYTALPAISPRVQAAARQATAGATTAYARAKALQDFFGKGFKYDLNVDPGHGEDALERFLFQTRRGYCEQYAGAYAVMARSIGLPARVAVGFTPGELQNDGRYHVRDEHAHAWPEVYLHGFGWVAFEPTPGRGAPNAAAYTGRPEAQDTSGDTGETATTATTAATPDTGDTGSTTIPDLGDSGAQVDTSPTPDPGLPAIVKVALVVLGLVALWAIVVPLLHVRRRRARRSRPGTGAQVLADWEDTAEVLSAAGVSRRPAETMAEYAGRAGAYVGLQPDPSRALKALARDAAMAAYASIAVDDEVVARSGQAARLVQDAVHDQVSPAARVAWWLDPRPLVTAADRHG
jgi:transglutaminase-like putative cysteine protease